MQSTRTTILILGAGPGGVTTANTIARDLPADSPHDVIVVDKQQNYTVGAGKTMVAMGTRTVQDVITDTKKVLHPRVEFKRADVKHINVDKREVITDGVDALTFDVLVIALGVDYTLNTIPGLEQAAYNYYTFDGTVKLRDALPSMEGRKITVLVAKTPYVCPMGPLEAALCLADRFKSDKQTKTQVEIVTPEPVPLFAAGPSISQQLLDTLASHHISFWGKRMTKSVNHVKKEILFEDGSSHSYDVLVAIPGATMPEAVAETGLCGKSGYLPVDIKTMRIINGPSNVYAVGDVTSVSLPGKHASHPEVPLFMPKAGEFARMGGLVAAQTILDKLGIKTQSSAEFHGKGACFVDMGNGQVGKGVGDFFHLPHPEVKMEQPSVELAKEKEEWMAKLLAKG